MHILHWRPQQALSLPCSANMTSWQPSSGVQFLFIYSCETSVKDPSFHSAHRKETGLLEKWIATLAQLLHSLNSQFHALVSTSSLALSPAATESLDFCLCICFQQTSFQFYVHQREWSGTWLHLPANFIYLWFLDTQHQDLYLGTG